MNRILHDKHNAQRILKLTADTLLLIDRNGVCVDVDTHSDLWFLQEKFILGQNIFRLLPEETREAILPIFRAVIDTEQGHTENFRMKVRGKHLYFKCIMSPYDDMVLCQYRDITQRSNIRNLLEQTNRMLYEIQKVAMIGQWYFHTDKTVIHFIGHPGALANEQEQHFTFDQYMQHVIEEDRPALLKWINDQSRGFTTESFTYRLRKDGQIFYLCLQTYRRTLLPDGNHRIEGYVQNLSDLQHSRNDINTLKRAINTAKESIFAVKADGTFFFANQRFRYHHGIDPYDDLTEQKIYDIVGDITTQEAWEERRQAIEKESVYHFVVQQPSKVRKEILALESVMYAITSDSGEKSYWAFSNDISERILYESHIKRLNLIMNATLNNLPAQITVKEIDNDFRYLYRNRALFDQQVPDSIDAVGKSDFDYYPEEIAAGKRREDEQVAATGKMLNWTTEQRDAGGQLFIVDKRKIRVDDDDLASPILVSIEWDITELERVKRELQAAKEKAELSDKLKSAFLANMSHEIRTPLNAIVGFSHLIAECEDAQERNIYNEIVEANNQRLLTLINEILDISKIESGVVEFKVGLTNLHRLCKEVFDAHTFRMPKGVELVYEPSEQGINLLTDKNRIFQVFANMIGNAIKFTQQGRISYGYKREGDEVVFHVSDTGTGIEADKVDKVFDRFAKLNDFAQGTGLGLSICKLIVEKLGGHISVSSELGKGTTFCFTLPYNHIEKAITEAETEGECISRETPLGTASALPYHRHAGRRKACILVAEDTDSNYILLEAMLGKEFKLIRAKDGLEAVLMYDDMKPDLILMDIDMPNLNGLEAAKIIRELSATVPIIAQSAHAYEEDKEEAKAAGCDDFLSKPISKEALRKILKKWQPKYIV